MNVKPTPKKPATKPEKVSAASKSTGTKKPASTTTPKR